MTIQLRFVTISAVLAVLVTGKRLSELIFPKGTTFTVNVALGLFMPEKDAKGFAHVVELDFIYPVVEKVSASMKKPPPKTVWINPISRLEVEKWESDWYRRNRMIKDRQRKNLRRQLEKAIDLFGFDGRQCVLRFQCELNDVTKPDSLLQDLLLILFKRRNLDCNRSNESCPFSLLQIILNSRYMNGTLY